MKSVVLLNFGNIMKFVPRPAVSSIRITQRGYSSYTLHALAIVSLVL